MKRRGARGWTWFAILLAALNVRSTEARTYVVQSPTEALIGTIDQARVAPEETLLDIARRYGLGYHEIRLSNPNLDIWIPEVGAPVTIPTQFLLPGPFRKGIVVNLAELRLYHYRRLAGGNRIEVVTYPLSVGRGGWETPERATAVVNKTADPSWYPPPSIRAEHAAHGRPLPIRIPPGPNNPLGRYSLRLGLPGYLIHGTNQPYRIGMRVTHGCMRLYPEDIKALFETVPIGTPVNIVNLPVKAGWHRGVLYLESHAGPDSPDGQDIVGPPPLTEAVKQIVAVTPRADMDRVDWGRVASVTKAQRGIPTPVSSWIRPRNAQPQAGEWP